MKEFKEREGGGMSLGSSAWWNLDGAIPLMSNIVLQRNSTLREKKRKKSMSRARVSKANRGGSTSSYEGGPRQITRKTARNSRVKGEP